MKLEFFRIRDCFGFVDSGEINLRDPKNMTYFLGRNSSGKSSVLRALEHFAYGIRPDQHSKFRNFDPPRDEPVLEAEFSISGGELPVRPVVEHVANAFRPMPVQITETNNGRFIAPDEPRVNAVLEVVQDGYETLLAEIERVGRVRIEKEHDGEYKFHIPSAGGDRTLYRMRRGAIEDALNRGRQQGTGRWVVSSNSYAFTLNRFADIEGVLARQLPDIFLFERRFALNNDLPHVITRDFLGADQNQLTKAFVTLLDKRRIIGWLLANNRKERTQRLQEMQARVDALCDKVNESRTGDPKERHLLKIFLEAKDGLQIIVEADGKQSFYEHLSDNTKFLFAYHLLRQTEHLKDAVLLFDEPNAGFHPSAERLVLDFLQTLADDGNLVVLTTHSQYMIDLDRLSGVRLMGSDENDSLRVINSIYQPASPGGDILALRPVTEAIGLRYAGQLIVKDKVIVTEGYTDMLYLRAFKRILGHGAELNIAPLRGESQIEQFIPFLISQGIAFKVVLDSKRVKSDIRRAYPIPDSCFFDPRPSRGRA